MKSVRVSAVIVSAMIGLTIGVGPAITAHLMPQIGMLDQLGAVFLGVIVGMQAASRCGVRHGRYQPRQAVGRSLTRTAPSETNSSDVALRATAGER